MHRRLSAPRMDSLRDGLSCSRSPFLNQWTVLTTMFTRLLGVRMRGGGAEKNNKDVLLCCSVVVVDVARPVAVVS